MPRRGRANMSRANVKYDDPPTAYSRSQQLLREVYDESEMRKGLAETENLSTNWVQGTGFRYGNNNLTCYARQFNRLRNTPGLNAYAIDMLETAGEPDPTYDFAGILNGVRQSCLDVMRECNAIIPQDANNVMQTFTLQADCDVQTQAFSPAEMATLPPLFQAIMDQIDRGVLETQGTRRRA